MKAIKFLLFFLFFYQSASAEFYVDVLDFIIDEKVAALTTVPCNLKNIVTAIRTKIKKQISLQDVEDFLDHKNSLAFYYSDKLQLRFDATRFHNAAEIEKTFNDLKFALGAKLYMHYLACARQKMLDVAFQNYEALSYWQHELFEEHRYFYQKNISRWFLRTEYQQQIQDNIVLLEKISQETNKFLGLIKYNQELLAQAKNQQEFEKNFILAVQIQEDFFGDFIEDEIVDHIENVIKKSIEQLSQFKTQLSFDCQQCRLPSHFERHQQAYILLTVALCASGFMYQNYKNEIIQGSQYFWQEHVQRPIDKIQDLLAGDKAPKIAYINVEKDQKLYEELVKAELGKPEPFGLETTAGQAFTHNLDELTQGGYSQVKNKIDIVGKFQEKVKDVVPVKPWTWTWGLSTESLGENMPPAPQNNDESRALPLVGSQDFDQLSFEEQEAIVFHKDCKTLSHPIENILKTLPAYQRRAVGTVLDGKKEVNEFIDQMNVYAEEMYKDNRLLLSCGAFIPVITLLGSGFFASHKIYNSVAYQPIRKFIRHVEILLNESLYEPVTFEREGSLYFYTEQLKLYSTALTLYEQKMMEVDIASLQSSKLDYVQKFNVVQRMYRTYPCLIPGAI
ncbi:hypothetical protein KBC04_05290 [Candidatus Babeliales bacterium]|nr:hypothetical protein [Candidatus Babeliales bacterium]MBP9844160.1 hypothetical protein [Candidatus Babeliales bacterium]